MSTKLADTAGLADEERQDLVLRSAGLRLVEYVASVLAGKIEQRLADAGQHFVRAN